LRVLEGLPPRAHPQLALADGFYDEIVSGLYARGGPAFRRDDNTPLLVDAHFAVHGLNPTMCHMVVDMNGPNTSVNKARFHAGRRLC
jgi:hypothetical protein